MEDFEAWYQRERSRVWAVAAALCGDVDAAAEATDEAFVRALERWPQVRAMVSPGGWVQVVALNHLRRTLGRRARERRLPAPDRRDVAASVLPDVDLWASVAALPARQRAAIVLRYAHDLTEADIARVLGISRGTVAASLAHAQRRLRQDAPDLANRDGTVTEKENSP